MQSLLEAANRIANEIERTRKHLQNLELALQGPKPLTMIDASITHQGAVDPRHVDYYLDEFTVRFNRRS